MKSILLLGVCCVSCAAQFIANRGWQLHDAERAQPGGEGLPLESGNEVRLSAARGVFEVRPVSGEEDAVSPLRWRMIGLAFFATAINYLDRQTLSVAAPILREQFHMSNEGYSRVVSAFLFAYTIMNGLSGPMIDRLGTRLGYGLCVAWWSIAAALHAFARGTFSLGVFRFLLGIGEAGNWPGAPDRGVGLSGVVVRDTCVESSTTTSGDATHRTPRYEVANGNAPFARRRWWRHLQRGDGVAHCIRRRDRHSGRRDAGGQGITSIRSRPKRRLDRRNGIDRRE